MASDTLVAVTGERTSGDGAADHNLDLTPKVTPKKLWFIFTECTANSWRWEMGRRGTLLVLVMAVALIVAGCGGNDNKGSGSGGQQASGPALKDLVTGGTLTVGTELPAPPFWIGDDYDSITGGYEVDLSKEIAKRLNIANVKFVEMPFAGLVAGQKCKCDIDFSQVTITPDRAKVVQFTAPYFEANQGILAKKGTTVSSMADAKRLHWGAQTNTTGAAYIADTIKPSSQPKIYNTTVDAFTALNAGQIDAVLLDTPIVLGAVKAGQIKDGAVVAQFKTGEEYGAVLNKGSPNVAAINQVISTLKSEGFTDQLFKKYFGADPTSVPFIS
jgi:polar amino acid transport system substrate-binding protein